MITSPVWIENGPAMSGTSVFRGITFSSNFEANDGTTVVEQCSLLTPSGALFFDGNAVLRSTFAQPTYGGRAVMCYGGSMSATDCTFLPGTANAFGDATVKVEGAWLSMARCIAIGVSTMPWHDPSVWPQPALRVGGFFDVGAWVVDCSLTGGNSQNGTPPAPGVHGANVLGAVRTHRCAITGGSSPAGSAPAVVGPEVPGPLLAFGSSGSPTIGGGVSLDARGEPNDPIVVVAVLQLVPWTMHPLVEQPAVGFANGVTHGLALAGAFGDASFPFSVPNTPALRYQFVHFRAFSLPGLPIQASPVVSLVVR